MIYPEFEHYAPDDKIDTRSFEIITRVFGLPSEEIIFISNDTLLDEVEDFSKSLEDELENPPKGHRLTRVTEIPLDDTALYDGDLQDQRRYVWYPPFSDAETRRMSVRDRIRAVRKVERTYGISMKQFKNIDEFPELPLATVAAAIDQALLSQLLEISNNREDPF